MIAEDVQEPRVLPGEVGVADRALAAQPVRARVHERLELEVLELPPLLRIDRHERRAQPRAARVQELVRVAEVLPRRVGVLVQDRVGPQHVEIRVALAELRQHRREELAVAHAPGDLGEIQPLHVRRIDVGQHLGGRSHLRDVLPRRRVDAARRHDGVQHARLGGGDELPLLGGLRRVVREVAGRREVERVLDRGGRVGLELDRDARVQNPRFSGNAPSGICSRTSAFRGVDVGFVTTIWQP